MERRVALAIAKERHGVAVPVDCRGWRRPEDYEWIVVDMSKTEVLAS